MIQTELLGQGITLQKNQVNARKMLQNLPYIFLEYENPSSFFFIFHFI